MAHIIRAWLEHWRQCLEAWAADRVTDAFADLDTDVRVSRWHETDIDAPLVHTLTGCHVQRGGTCGVECSCSCHYGVTA